MIKYFNQASEWLFTLLCLLALSGGIIYRLYALNNAGIIISLILAVSAFLIIQYIKRKYKTNGRETKQAGRQGQTKSFWDTILPLIYLTFLSFCFYLLLANRTAEAIISPWQAVPPYFFALYGLATIILIISIIREQKFAPHFISLHYFLSFAAALIIYRVGYGFDPFIHQATVSLIDKIGAVTPKPAYYLGQYGLIVIIHKLSALSLIWLDKILVPVMAALFLPLSMRRVLTSWLDDKKTVNLLILIMLSLTFPFFIVTTPQNLAYLFLIYVILLGLVCKNSFDLVIIFLAAGAALITQPIAGLPAFMFAVLLTIYHSDKNRLKKYLYPAVFLLSAAILPLAFYFLGQGDAAAAKEDASVPNLFASLKLLNPGQENFIINFIYLYGFNLAWIIMVLIAGGIYLAWRHKTECKVCLIYLAMALAMLLSYFLTIKLPFNFLISYERSDYAERILLMAVFFCLPFVLLALYGLLYQIIKQKNLIIKSAWLAFLSLVMTVAMYLSYPRLDNYYSSRGYSVSAADLAAVQWIEKDAGKDYIVLANQQVSAAALRQYGFKRYYNNDTVFYYPIPTGGPLYQYYLSLVNDQPTRETMLKAMDSVKIDTGYFVLNKYWWASPKILEEAKLEANSWQEFSDGQVYVFKYTK